MKWFNRWFAKKVQQAWEDAKPQPLMNEVGIKGSDKLSAVRSLGDHRSSMNIQVHSATGGYILEFTKYDRTRDEHERNLHIITDQQDLGEAISQVITVEMLRH